MRLIPSDPDIETIVGRIEDGSLDLQPEFQRGAVWSRPKQRLLIDSVLRAWYVPPVHVVRTDEDNQIVLDGQQRLNSIFQFVQGRFTVDGSAEPLSPDVQALGGLHYDQLPKQVRRRFDRFTVRIFEVVDYVTEEPFELFYRLNQPTPLTSAEKRNAFFGAARAQIRELTELAEVSGMTPDRVGFTNARLAYEDIVARFVWTLEARSLDEKVTAARVTERYRDSRPFNDSTIDLAAGTLARFFRLSALDRPDMRFNKAMLHTWLCFVARGDLRHESLPDLDSFVPDVEIGRLAVKGRTFSDTVPPSADGISLAYSILNDRATSRVNDVSSVILRDVVLWALYCDWHPCDAQAPRLFSDSLRTATTPRDAEQLLLEAVATSSWSSLE